MRGSMRESKEATNLKKTKKVSGASKLKSLCRVALPFTLVLLVLPGLNPLKDRYVYIQKSSYLSPPIKPESPIFGLLNQGKVGLNFLYYLLSLPFYI